MMMRPFALFFCLAGLLLAAPPEEFRFDASSPQRRAQIWEGGNSGTPDRRYFDELLPALFERTLRFSSFDLAGGTLEWVFTGDRAGITVELSPTTVRLVERYYDSFALREPVDAEKTPSRHPQRITAEAIAPVHGQPSSLTVRLDHRLGVSVLIDGAEVLRRHCLFDLRRHQLAFAPVERAMPRIAGTLQGPEAQTVDVRVHPSHRHQTILGFGGITTPTAYAALSPEGKRRWWRIVAEYNLLLQREYPNGVRLNREMTNWDRLADASPHAYGDNFPNGEISDFSYNRTLRKLGGEVLFEFWGLPLWARADPEAYARAVVNYCRTSRERTGAPPAIVGIQNEVAQPVAVWRQMALTLRRRLDEAGFASVKIHMRDASRLSQGIEAVRQLRRFDDAWKVIDYSASHMYDFQKHFYDPDGFDAVLEEWKQLTAGKPFLSTELCVNDAAFQVDSFRLALSLGQLYHKNLAILDAVAVIYCWTLLNAEQPSFGWTRSLLVPDWAGGGVPVPSSRQLRVFGAYSRRVRQGMVRLEAVSPDPGLLVTAFTGPDGASTLIALNRSTRPLLLRLSWDGAAFRYRETAGPYQPNAVEPATAGEVRIEPGTVVTLSNVALSPVPPS